MSLLFIYIIWKRWYDKYNYLATKSKRNSENPILYLNLIEGAAYLNFTIAVTYSQSFHGRKIHKFLNKLLRYSKKFKELSANHNYNNLVAFFLHKNFPLVLNIGTALVTIIAVLNPFIYSNFDTSHETLLSDAVDVFFWGECSTEICKKRTMANTLIAAFNAVVWIVRNVRDMYAEMFFVAGIAPLYFVSNVFLMNVEAETFVKVKSFSRTCSFYQAYKYTACLSRAFSFGHGYALLSYLAYYLIYYSIKLDTLFINGLFGKKVYILQFFGTVTAVLGLGVSFSYKVSHS